MGSGRHFAYTTFAVLLGVGASVSWGDGVALVQWSAKKAKGRAEAAILPDVVGLMEKPASLFATMNTKVGALSEHLTNVEKRNALKVAAMKTEYDGKLEAQRHDIDAAGHLNEAINSEIKRVDRNVTHLRHTAEELTKKNDVLVNDLHILQSNLTIGIEGIDKLLQDSDKTLNGTELEVLSELAAEDAKGESAKQRDMIAHSAPSLLQLSAQPKEAATAPQELVQLMASALDELAAEQNASETILSESFQSEFHTGAARLDSVLSEQAKLNMTRTEHLHVLERVSGAVKHLYETHFWLVARCTSLRAFVG